MKSSTTNNPLLITYPASGFVTSTTPVVTSTGGAGPTYSWNIMDRSKAIYIGDCKLEEIDNELYWVRPDGSKTCLTGKGKNFDNLYDKLNNP